jgi:hypothetical protein
MSLFLSFLNDTYQLPVLHSILSQDECEDKVVSALPLTQHHAMKAYWGSGGAALPIL